VLFCAVQVFPLQLRTASLVLTSLLKTLAEVLCSELDK